MIALQILARDISNRNNYHCYCNINNGFTVEVREQYHICDLMGHRVEAR